ncbi:hypothetical protein L873DRAFT_1808387, partial [Choiromyces venosus 120613-1]
SLFFPLLWATLAATQKLEESTLKLKELCITPLSQLLPKASVLDVLASANCDFVAEDVRTIGMSYKATNTSTDAYDAGTYESKHITLVSCYDARGVSAAENKDARIAFVDRDKNPDAYRYVLLVEPYDNAGSVDFRSVKVHARGIAWYGNSLYVVDASRGFRVFDLTQIWKVESGDGIGRKAVLPQSRTYTATDPPTPALRFSFISLDCTTTPDSLMVGEYQTALGPEPRRFVRWSIDYTNRQLVTDSAGIATATWAYQVNIDRMQGVNSINGKFYISRSNGGFNGHLITWVPGNLAKITGGAVPEGPEDLSYDKTSRLMYTFTEPVNGEYILPFDPTVLP